MSYKKLFWGILLVFIGILFILKNMGWIYFDWWTVFRLWPLLLILWGISIIPLKGYIKLILSFVAIAITVIVVAKYDDSERPFMNWHHGNNHSWSFDVDDDDYDDDTLSGGVQELFQAYDSTVKRAVLSFDAAAGDFQIADSLLDENLLVFQKTGNIGDYSMTSTQEQETDTREITLKIKDSHVKLRNHGNKVRLYLNPKPIWDFDFDIGAAKIDFDLSKFNVENVKVDGGASSIFLKLGNVSNYSKVKIDAGAASIVINVPKDSGVEINTDTVLTSKNFQGFNNLGEGRYQTGNFATATSKILLEVDAGVSSLTINRY